MRYTIFLCFLAICFFSNDSFAQCVTGDCKNGKGVFKFSNGATYEGQFVDGMRHGDGTFHYPNGNVYNGTWAYRFPDGQGTMSYADGTEEKGYWKKGKYLGVTAPAEEDDAIVQDVVPTKKPLTDVTAKGGTPTGIKTYGESVYEVGKKLKMKDVEDVNMYAVVIGVSDYTVMPRLKYTDDDAYQIYAFLKSPEGGALPDDQIRILIDESATQETIEATMRETFGKADENDVIMLYFSGHGLKGSFLPIDYNGKEHKISHSTILSILDESPAKHKLCIADACHSGSLTAMRSKTAVDRTIKTFYDAFKITEGGTALFLSSKSDEISLESNGLRQGIFSHFLIRGMKGEADSNLDKIITVQELHRFVSDNVTDFTGAFQSPLLKGDYDKNMPVGVIRY